MYITRRSLVFFIYFSTLCLAIVIDASRGYTKQEDFLMWMSLIVRDIRDRLAEEFRQPKATDYRPFTFGLRYGKRTNWDDQPLNDMLPPIMCGIYEDLSCHFTGVSNIYRCTRRIKQGNEDYPTQK